MSSLYELTAEYQQLLEMAEDPEVDSQAFADTLEGLDGEIEDKADAYAKVIRTIESDIASVDFEIKRLQSRKKTMQNSIDRMKSALHESMKATGKTKFKTPLFSFGIAKNGGKLPIVYDNGFDALNLPKELQDWSVEPDTEAIRKALEAGEEVRDVHFGERGEHLNIK